jgi:hypothetical protein
VKVTSWKTIRALVLESYKLNAPAEPLPAKRRPATRSKRKRKK